MKKWSFRTPLIFLICNTAILFSGHWSLARDLGTHGITYLIEEEDPIALVQSKLKEMEKNGELERHHQELQKKTRSAIERPKPVERITKAQESYVFYYDPTYVVKEDLKDHTGKAFYKKGTKINPLEAASLSQNLLFFDGEDMEQVAFAKEKLKENPLKLILVNGAPLALSEELNAPVYFDQAGFLTQKLRIKHVPAFVIQDSLFLRIEVVKCEGKK